MGITSLGLNTNNREEIKEAAAIGLSLLTPYDQNLWEVIQTSADALNCIGMITDPNKSYIRHLITATYMHVYARNDLGSGIDPQADSFPAILATEDFANDCGLKFELDTDEYVFLVTLLERFIAELQEMEKLGPQ